MRIKRNRQSHSIEIHHVDLSTMRALRKRFKLDHDPSVLSFPAPKSFKSPKGHAAPYGEVFLCPQLIRKEAKKAKVAYKDHEAYLLAHGVLHLLGYDHKKDQEAKRMERIERRLTK